MNELKRRMINKILSTEGGFVDDPLDLGGATNRGITEGVAREHGYVGLMELLTEEIAFGIYSTTYWNLINGDEVLMISHRVCEEIFDSAVNLGAGRACQFFQRVLNVLNGLEELYDDLLLDGNVGPLTLAAFRACIDIRGEKIIVLSLNCLQGAYYIELAEKRPKNERFVYGWLANRVLL